MVLEGGVFLQVGFRGVREEAVRRRKRRVLLCCLPSVCVRARARVCVRVRALLMCLCPRCVLSVWVHCPCLFFFHQRAASCLYFSVSPLWCLGVRCSFLFRRDVPDFFHVFFFFSEKHDGNLTPGTTLQCMRLCEVMERAETRARTLAGSLVFAMVNIEFTCGCCGCVRQYVVCGVSEGVPHVRSSCPWDHEVRRQLLRSGTCGHRPGSTSFRCPPTGYWPGSCSTC